MEQGEVFDAESQGEQSSNLQQVDRQTRTWAMLLHFSLFLNYIVPIAGLIAPILIWQIKKDELPGIEVHGRNVVNFIISMLIYSVISILLCFFLIGFALLPILGLMAIVFPIIGGIKANDGIAWPYPMMIKFI